MKKITILLTTAIIVVFCSAAFPQSLAELAKKEKERRAKMKAEAKVITDVDTSKYKGGAVSTALPAATPTPAGEENKPPATEAAEQSSSQAGPQEAEEPVDFEGRPESYWRQTFTDARQQVIALENEANVLVLKLNELQNKFYQEADGFKQQQIQREIQKALYEQDLNKQQLNSARLQLQELEVEARKSGALPGWYKP